jgi:DNA-binding transcriptional MerR regulator
MEKALPSIPAKRYFTIGEVSDLCGVKPYVLRYWEQEFTQLKPMKRRGNRRYYQHHEVLLIRRIRDLLYGQGFTISGARNRLSEAHHGARADALLAAAGEMALTEFDDDRDAHAFEHAEAADAFAAEPSSAPAEPAPLSDEELRRQLLSIRSLLGA